MMKDEGNKINITGDAYLLRDDVSRLFNSFFGEVLNILSSRFPHIKGDGSDNENQFLCLRAKILRCGNNKIRDELSDIVSDYYIKKIKESTTEKVVVGQKVK